MIISSITALGALFDRPLYLAFYFGLAVGVVHISQRIIEHATLHIEQVERKAGIARAAFTIGSLTWILDIAGFFLYSPLKPADAALAPVLLALCLMIAIARFSVPKFTNTAHPMGAWMGAVGMAVGVLGVHLLVGSSVGLHASGLHLGFAFSAVVLGTTISGGLSLLHRSSWLKRVPATPFIPLSWPSKAGAGLAILLLHGLLTHTFRLAQTPMQGHHPLLLILGLGVLAILVTSEIHRNQGADHRRRQLFDRAMALIRSGDSSHGTDGGIRLGLIAERVERILEKQHFSLYFQPIVCVESGCTRFEALLRVKDPELGVINPEQFFLACERKEFTVQADEIILKTALAASRDWIETKSSLCGISVNVAPQTLLSAGFVHRLNTLLRALSIPKDWLQLEITEHAIVSSGESMCTVLRQLSENGISVYLDDFGSGFSSLGLLSDLPIQGIKCDRSLVRGVHEEGHRQVILSHICSMARTLGLCATVEGVESDAELEAVRACGATTIQGFLIQRPIPQDQVSFWLEESLISTNAP